MKSNLYTVAFAVVLGLVCSLLLTAVAERVKPRREENEKAERYLNVLKVFDIAVPENASNEQIKELQSQLQQLRSELPSDTKSEAYAKKQTEIENLKTEIDKVSSNSQLDMIKLQGLINKRNQSVEMMSNMIQKFSSLMDKIVGNMR